jgi:putative SOS response-associated peptidase YedK
MAEIHNSAKRMPVILQKTEESKWLSCDTPLSETLELLRPCSSEMLKAHTISPLINDKSSNRNTAEMIRPYDYNSGSLLF